MAGSNRTPHTMAPPSWMRPEMAGKGAPAERDEQLPTQAHWPQARQPEQSGALPQSYAQDQPSHGQQVQHHQGFAPLEELYQQRPHQPAAIQPRQDWANGHERDFRAFPQVPRGDAQAFGQTFAQPQTSAAYQQPPQQGWAHGDFGHTHAYPAQGQQDHAAQPGGYHDPHQFGYAGHQNALEARYAQWPDHATDQAYNLDHYAQQQPGQAGYAQHPHEYDLQGSGDHSEIEDFQDDEPESRRGPRASVVVAALVGAIAVGGGLAYGYRMLGGSKGTVNPPIVKADKAPAKVKPIESGGKDVAHTDKKFLNSLSEDGKSPAAAASATATAAPAAGSLPAEPEAPRKVTTLVVNRDGTLSPQANMTAPAVPAAPTTATPPPGMIVEGGTPRAPLRGASGDAPAPAAAPKVAELPVPRVKQEPPQQPIVAFPAPTQPEAAVPKATVVKKKPTVRDDAAVPQATAATAAVAPATQAKATTSSTTGAVLGYVPVLASKKSREEALKSFADMHQKFPDILGGKSPDVVQVDLPDKGTYFRLIVGPPGSKEAGQDVCKKLATQGFGGCWITAYRQ